MGCRTCRFKLEPQLRSAPTMTLRRRAAAAVELIALLDDLEHRVRRAHRRGKTQRLVLVRIERLAARVDLADARPRRAPRRAAAASPRCPSTQRRRRPSRRPRGRLEAVATPADRLREPLGAELVRGSTSRRCRLRTFSSSATARRYRPDALARASRRQAASSLGVDALGRLGRAACGAVWRSSVCRRSSRSCQVRSRRVRSGTELGYRKWGLSAATSRRGPAAWP